MRIPIETVSGVDEEFSDGCDSLSSIGGAGRPRSDACPLLRALFFGTRKAWVGMSSGFLGT